MIYFDTNILVYATILQDVRKHQISIESINSAILQENFSISSLVFSEYVFTLSKLKIIEKCEKYIKFYQQYIYFDVKKDFVIRAYEKCNTMDKCRNINDFIHLEMADKYCRKLVTFDSDFKNLQQYYSVDI